MRAYSRGAKISVENSGIVLFKECSVLKMRVEYSLYGKVENILKGCNAKIADAKFLETVELIVNIPLDEFVNMGKKIREISSGNILFEIIDKKCCSME